MNENIYCADEYVQRRDWQAAGDRGMSSVRAWDCPECGLTGLRTKPIVVMGRQICRLCAALFLPKQVEKQLIIPDNIDAACPAPQTPFLAQCIKVERAVEKVARQEPDQIVNLAAALAQVDRTMAALEEMKVLLLALKNRHALEASNKWSQYWEEKARSIEINRQLFAEEAEEA